MANIYREIRIDEDTLIGYDYEKRYYYITNQATTTTRITAQRAKQVLDIVAPSNAVTIEDLNTLATKILSLEKLYYTWEDTGAYIKTIQLNDYAKYPLTLDAEKKKLYIMNSPLVFDLILNVDMKHRLEQMQAFYKDTVGLLVDLRILRTLYTVLTNYLYDSTTMSYTYKPACYNVLQSIDYEDNTHALIYTDTLKLFDYLGTARANYTCTLNPHKQYTPHKIADILRIEGNAITLAGTVPSSIQKGSTITLTNTATTVDTTSYSANGTYTVSSIEGNTIYTTENLPANFYVLFPTLNIVAYKTTIQEINREKQTITLTNPATNFVVGDKVMVRGAKVDTEYETLTLDRFYTIIGIEGNTLYVEELPLTDYTPTEPYTAYIYKPIEVGSVTNISTGGVIEVTEGEYYSKLTTDTEVVEITPDEDLTELQYATVTSIDGTTVVLDTPWHNNVMQAGILNEPVPYGDVLIEVTNSTDTAMLPNDTFMVDNQEQAIQYLGLLLPSDILPNHENPNNLGSFANCNKAVNNYYIISIDIGEVVIDNMELLGLYKEVYTEND